MASTHPLTWLHSQSTVLVADIVATCKVRNVPDLMESPFSGRKEGCVHKLAAAAASANSCGPNTIFCWILFFDLTGCSPWVQEPIDCSATSHTTKCAGSDVHRAWGIYPEAERGEEHLGYCNNTHAPDADTFKTLCNILKPLKQPRIKSDQQ